jgi:hypothetical protein
LSQQIRREQTFQVTLLKISGKIDHSRNVPLKSLPSAIFVDISSLFSKISGCRLSQTNDYIPFAHGRQTHLVSAEMNEDIPCRSERC